MLQSALHPASARLVQAMGRGLEPFPGSTRLGYTLDGMAVDGRAHALACPHVFGQQQESHAIWREHANCTLHRVGVLTGAHEQGTIHSTRPTTGVAMRV